MADTIGGPGFLIGVAALLLTLIVPYLYRRRRSMLYRVWCNSSLLNETETEEGRTVMMHGRQRDARDLWVYVLEVSNFDGSILGGWGGTDITPSRFHRPLSFTYGDSSRVIDQQVLDEDPDGLNVNLKAGTRNSTVIEPTLLNQRDSFTLRVIVEKPKVEQRLYGNEGAVHADGRIEGIRRIKRSPNASDFLRWASISLGLGGTILIGTDFFIAPLLGYGPLPDYSEVGYEWLYRIGYGFVGGLLPFGILSLVLYEWLKRQSQHLYDDARRDYRISKPKISEDK